jgi:hypothetical protein
MALSLLLLLASASAQVGPWAVDERCPTGSDNIGCTRTMFQSSPAIEVTLIFRDSFQLRGVVRSCDAEPVGLSFTPDSAWSRKTTRERAVIVRSFVSAWMKTAHAGCPSDRPTPSISLANFEDLFARLSSDTERYPDTLSR